MLYTMLYYTMLYYIMLYYITLLYHVPKKSSNFSLGEVYQFINLVYFSLFHFMIQEDKLNYALLVALAEGSVDFVKLFISYGVSLSKLLDKKTLEFLYAYRSKESTLKYHVKSRKFVTTTGNNLYLLRRRAYHTI